MGFYVISLCYHQTYQEIKHDKIPYFPASFQVSLPLHFCFQLGEPF